MDHASMSITVGSLFSGIGGFDLALERTGYDITFQVENNPFCRRVLRKHWPGVKQFGDVRTVGLSRKSQRVSDASQLYQGVEGGGQSLLPVDLLVGGFPCQDLSVAGKRKGLAGERSGLFYEIVRIAKEIKPTWGLFENVPGLLSSHDGRDMWTVLSGLRECWNVVGYRVFDSRYFGVAQRRRRVFFVCGPTESGVEQVLFEPEGGAEDSAAGGEAGAHVAASLRSRSHRPGVNAPGRGGEDDMNIVISNALQERGGKGPDSDCTQTMVIQALTNLGSGEPDDNEAQGGHLVTHPLTADGFDASEDGTGRGTPLYYSHDYNQDRIYGTDAPIPAHTANDSNRARNVQTLQGVRRLTPIECALLQGFPPSWTCLCDQEPCTCPDGPQYRAYGNAVTVNVIEWLGQRILSQILPG